MGLNYYQIKKNILRARKLVIKAFFSTKSRKTKFSQMDNICSDDCKSAKAVFVRSFTLITNSKKIDLTTGNNAALPPLALFLSINQNISNADSSKISSLIFVPKFE